MRIFSSAYRGLKIGSLFNEKRLLENLGSRHQKLTSWAGGFLKKLFIRCYRKFKPGFVVEFDKIFKRGSINPNSYFQRNNSAFY